MNNQYPKRQLGIGIIEVMVAAVIFALGIVAIIQLQGNFFTSSSAAQAHSISMNLAEEKIEDLRGFEAFNDTDPDIFDFTSIVNNSGGQCDAVDDGACALTMPSGNVTIGNTTFNRTWTVTDYYYNAGALTTTPNGPIAQKDIMVNVTWTDVDGTAQTNTANAVINSSLVGSGGVLVSNAGGSGESPEVPYTPSTSPRVTPIEVGTSSKRETLVPSSQTVNGYARTQFTAYTYNSSNILQRQEEFKNVACQCRFNGTSSTGNETYAASYPVWDDIQDTYVDETGELLTGKVKGCVQGGGNNCATNPEPFCAICCRDHHDQTGVARKYDPYRGAGDYEANGNHKHYNGTTPVTSGPYQESCRLKRVDGFWRVFQDWHLVNFDAVTLDDLNNATTKAAYATYAKNIIDQHIDESKVAGQTLTSPPAEPAATNHNTPGNYVSMTAGTSKEISGRALYLDYMDGTHLSEVQAKKTANEDYLLHIPFYEVEVVEVAKWTSANTSVVEVGPIDRPGNSNDVPAGRMDALVNNTNAVVVSSNIRQSNSGLTSLNFAVDYNAATNPDSQLKTDSLTVCVGCTANASCTAPWGATVAHGSSVVADQSQTVVAPAVCQSQVRNCNNGVLSGSYQYAGGTCTVAPPGSCTTPWGASVADGGSVTAYFEQTPPSACTSETRICSSGMLSGSYQYQNCTVTPVTCNTTVTGKANNKNDAISVSDGTTTTTCTVAASKNYTCPTITTPTSATISVISAGFVNATVGVATCGSQTVNF